LKNSQVRGQAQPWCLDDFSCSVVRLPIVLSPCLMAGVPLRGRINVSEHLEHSILHNFPSGAGGCACPHTSGSLPVNPLTGDKARLSLPRGCPQEVWSDGGLALSKLGSAAHWLPEVSPERGAWVPKDAHLCTEPRHGPKSTRATAMLSCSFLPFIDPSMH
jgi:hypothetical protein